MRRRLVILVSSAALLSGILPSAVGAANAPLPASMVAVGDSISQAASTGGSLGADYPQNAWSTGTNTTVNSHYLRLLAAGAPISGAAHNLAVSGAKVGGLDAQMQAAVPLQPDYLTVLIGGNDLCTDTVGSMTSTTAFESAFRTAMNTITRDSDETRVYVASIPDVYQLWSLFKSNWWARIVWSAGAICQSLLANPTSTQQADVLRRAEVRTRNQAFNAILADVCKDYARCHHDGGRVFAYQFARSDVSGDYFHPSTSGQANLARETWLAGYTWTTEPEPPQNQAPVAAFDVACDGLSCSFDASDSTDDGGIVGYAWDFDDGSVGTGVTVAHAYAADNSYDVTLTVTDAAGLTGTLIRAISVAEPPPNQTPVASFSSSCPGLTCSFTDTSTDADGEITSWAWTFDDGGTSTSASPSHTFAAGGTYEVALTVTDNDGASATAVESVSVEAPVAAAPIRVASLEGSSREVNRNYWQALVVVQVTDTTGALIGGATVSGSLAGSAKNCTTTSAGTCQLSSDNIRRNVGSVTFQLTAVTHATLLYDPAENVVTSVTVPRPA